MKILILFRKHALIFILFFYFIIASCGIFFNYSLFNTTGDEAPLLSATLKMVADKSFRPNYPTFYHLSLGAYIYLPFFLIFLLFLRLSGLFSSIEAIKQFGQIEFAKLLPLARFITVLSGLVCLYLLYKICEKLFNNRLVSLLATFFLSTSLLFVQTSHFARIWIPQVMTILLAFYFIISLYQAQRVKVKDYLLCGLGIGLAFGTHVVGIFIYISFLAVLIIKNSGGIISSLDSSGSPAGFFKKLWRRIADLISNKYFWLTNFTFALIYYLVYFLNTYGFSRYLGGFLPNLNKMHSLSGTFGAITDRPDAVAQAEAGRSIGQMLSYYFNALWQNEPLILLAAIFGTIVLYFKKQKKLLIIIYSFIFVYFLAISSLSMRTPRYLLPILPFLAIFSAYGFAWLYGAVEKRKRFVGALIGIFGLLLLYAPLLWDYKFLLPSTRLTAVNWIYDNLPADESIINFDQGLELNENRQSLSDIKKYSNFFTKKRAYLLNSSDEILPAPNYYVFFYPHYGSQVPEEILKKKFNYLIISWWDNKNYRTKLTELKKLNLSEGNLTLLKRFPAEATQDDFGIDLGGSIERPLITLLKLKQNGPVVDIYKIRY